MQTPSNNISSDNSILKYTEEWAIAEIDKILNEMRVKSGQEPLSDSPKIHIVEPGTRIPLQKIGAGAYLPGPNKLFYNRESGEYCEPAGLMTTIHERVHARGFNAFRVLGFHRGKLLDILDNIWKKGLPRTRSGYSYHISSEMEGFNEGVTQLITEEVYDRFIEYLGLSHLKVQRFEDNSWYWENKNNQGFKFQGLVQEVSNVKEFIKDNALYYSVPEEVVWNAIKRGYFEGIDLLKILNEEEEL